MSEEVRRVEVITSVQRRRRWSVAEKIRLVEETLEPGMSVSFVARKHGLSPSLLFKWRQRMAAIRTDLLEDPRPRPGPAAPILTTRCCAKTTPVVWSYKLYGFLPDSWSE